jgi:hypothetical protein
MYKLKISIFFIHMKNAFIVQSQKETVLYGVKYIIN